LILIFAFDYSRLCAVSKFSRRTIGVHQWVARHVARGDPFGDSHFTIGYSVLEGEAGALVINDNVQSRTSINRHPPHSKFLGDGTFIPVRSLISPN
jgi:hypothetical protein